MLFNSHSHIYTNKNTVIINKSDEKDDCNGSFFSYGVHPWSVNSIEDNFLIIEQGVKNKNCLAIGEIGLDKIIGPKIQTQIDSFTKQIEISERLELPVIIHCVKAWNELYLVYKQIQPKQKWIFHGFNKVGILQDVLKTEIMISIGASIFTNVQLQKSIDFIPNEKLLLETDDAEIDILEIYQKVSEIKKISLQELEQIIEENFKRTFKKWQSGLSVQNY
jgi:TatD DNase family protein